MMDWLPGVRFVIVVARRSTRDPSQPPCSSSVTARPVCDTQPPVVPFICHLVYLLTIAAPDSTMLFGDIMAALNDIGVRVLPIGTGRHSADSGLDPVPAVERSARDVGEVLVERCGLARERLRIIIDAATDGNRNGASRRGRAGHVVTAGLICRSRLSRPGRRVIPGRSVHRPQAWSARVHRPRV
jgi:hypothetical protein